MPSTRTTLLILSMASCLLTAAPCYGQHWFSFCDDFGKDPFEQRNGWEERIETERHDFTQSAVTVGRHVAQLEAGFSYFHNDADERETAYTAPEMLLRVGWSEDIELRLRWNYAWQYVEDEDDVDGAEDLRFSLKLQMSRPEEGEDTWRPTSALEIRGSAPTGGDAFSADQADFGLDYIYQWDLCEAMTIAGSTGFGTNGLGDFGLVEEAAASGERYTVFSQSFVVGQELSEQNTIYYEWFGLYSTGLPDSINQSYFNIGIDHYVTDNFVIDYRIGVGLTKGSDDIFTGVGGGVRF